MANLPVPSVRAHDLHGFMPSMNDSVIQNLGLLGLMFGSPVAQPLPFRFYNKTRAHSHRT